MNKREACYKLAEINEKIYEIENMLSNIESRLIWDDESKKPWYLERKEQLTSQLSKCLQEHDDFINEYKDILYS